MEETATPEMMESDHNGLPNGFYSLPSDTSIRLLKIKGISKAEGSPPIVVWDVEIFELDESPEFIALSYTWGDPILRNTSSIPADGEGETHTEQRYGATIAPVSPDGDKRGGSGTRQHVAAKRTYTMTKNLCDALYHLFLLGCDDKWIWVDAVCIDQEDEREKSVQVARMDDIYSTAHEVIVWLGEDATDPTEFIWLHTDYLDALDNHHKENGAEEMKRQQPLDPAFAARLGVSVPGGSWRACWRKYGEFYRRWRWFTRAWVVQEVTLARNKRVMFGKYIIDWNKLALLGVLIVVFNWEMQLSQVMENGLGRVLGDEIARLIFIREEFLKRHGASTGAIGSADNNFDRAPTLALGSITCRNRLGWMCYFQTLLAHTRQYSATDPRDKVYALFGLLKRTLPAGLAVPFSPDYSPASTAISLFTSVASFLISGVPRLEALSCRVSGDELTVPGAKFDSIVGSYGPLTDFQTSEIGDCLELCRGISSEYLPKHSDPGEVLWRTMIANTFQRMPAPAAMGQSFRYWLSGQLAENLTPDPILQRDQEGNIYVELDDGEIEESLGILDQLRHENGVPGESCIPGRDEVVYACRFRINDNYQQLISRIRSAAGVNRPIPRPERQQLDLLENKAKDFELTMKGAFPFKRLYRTSQGRLGLGPASLQVGDQVWLLRTAKVPFVLRPREDGSYMFMGETTSRDSRAVGMQATSLLSCNMLAKMCLLGSWAALLRFHDGIAEVGRWLVVEATVMDARTLAQKTPRPTPRPPNDEHATFSMNFLHMHVRPPPPPRGLLMRWQHWAN
ncbi:heterokaryon incompatibility protein-domain-containing protein [Apiospora hydei]|uniref:Heterokaryon incompatibility protein-domain-containing protein n=1 Tax=Apiospora hydei TaxID=1337664 RepID=A0ABR1VIX7_9PEZI